MQAATRALILAAWQERWNRMWRFSAVKPGLWLGLLQLAFVGLMLWRLGGAAPGANLSLMLIAIVAQAGAGSFLGALARGRESLYTAPVLPLIQISPAPAFSLVAAEVGAELPGRVWSALLLSAALSPMLTARAWGVPLLMLVALGAGALGQLAGLLSLMGWVRFAPRTLGAAMAAAMLVYVGVLGYLLYLLAVGIPVAAGLDWLHSNQTWLIGGLAGFLGLPGLAMCLWLLVSPTRAGASYRESWLNLKELAGDSSRPRHSRLPALIGGAAGVIQAKDWVQSARNKLTLLRLAVWVGGIVALIIAGPALSRVAPDRQALLISGLGIGLAWLSLGELVGALFSVEGARIALYVVAGVRPVRLLAAKLLAAAPLALLAGVGNWVAAASAGVALPVQMRMLVLGGALGLGMTGIMVGVAAVRIAVQEEEPDEVSPEMAGMLEQVPRGGWAWAGQGAAVVYGAAGVVAAGGLISTLTSTLSLLLVAVLLTVPCLALGCGYLSLRHLFHHSR